MSVAMTQVLLVAAGGAAGAVSRFLLGIGLAPILAGPWPTRSMGNRPCSSFGTCCML